MAIPSTNCVLEAVEICLKSNDSVLKGHFFYKFMAQQWAQRTPVAMRILPWVK